MTDALHAAEQASGLVVVIDDSRTVLASAEAMLRRTGFDVVTAADPSSLEVERVRAADVVFVDINMDQVFGDDVVSILRESWQVACPIYLYSTIDGEELATRAKAAGAAGGICKSGGTQALVKQALRVVARGASS